MSSEASGRVQKILVVDDNEHNRLVAEGHLVAAGYAVALAEDGAAALESFEKWRPDLVLLDILMPGIDGFETCKRLRTLPGGTDTPIVFLTALSDLGSHQSAIDSGADDFLNKPINRTELIIRVRSLLWVKRLKDELSEGYELIRSQRDALIRAQRQKEELSALIVHDLKNPLASVLANVQYLIEGSELTADDRECMADVLTSAESIHRMIMNLLDISRSEDGSLALQFAEVDLDVLVSEVCANVKRRSSSHDVKIGFEVGAPSLRADRDLLQRVLENLLDNALKHTQRQGTVQVITRHSADGSVEIRVHDEGPGVPVEYREKIFDKYTQLDADAKTYARTSRGLGLTFCRLAVEAHGGRIWVEENLPRGSAFCVRLPAQPAIG